MDAVPYDGIENGERKTKMQIKSKKTTRGKGFPGVSLRASGGSRVRVVFFMKCNLLCEGNGTKRKAKADLR